MDDLHVALLVHATEGVLQKGAHGHGVPEQVPSLAHSHAAHVQVAVNPEWEDVRS